MFSRQLCEPLALQPRQPAGFHKTLMRPDGGAQLRGDVGPKMSSDGTPRPAARCDKPESLPANPWQWVNKPANSPKGSERAIRKLCSGSPLAASEETPP